MSFVPDFISKDPGWLQVAVLLSLFAPFCGCIVMWALKLTMNKNATFEVDFFAPYRDGQLGYVVVGWAGAALLELSQLVEQLDFRLAHHILTEPQYVAAIGKSHEWIGRDTGLCWTVGALSALIAASGAANPIDTKTALEPWFWKRVKQHSSFLQSLLLTVLGYWVVNDVHNRFLEALK